MIKKNIFLDEMNLLKIIRWTINPQKYSVIPGRSWLENVRQIRWQTTDIPPNVEPSADVSTKVAADETK